MRHDCPHCVNGLRTTGGSSTSSKYPCPYCGGKGYTEVESVVEREIRTGLDGCLPMLLFGAMLFVLAIIANALGIGEKKENRRSKPSHDSEIIGDHNGTESTGFRIVTESSNPQSNSEGASSKSNPVVYGKDKAEVGASVYISSVYGNRGDYECTWSLSNRGQNVEYYIYTIGIREYVDGARANEFPMGEGYYFTPDTRGAGSIMKLGAFQPGESRTFTHRLTLPTMRSDVGYQIWIGIGDMESPYSLSDLYTERSYQLQ